MIPGFPLRSLLGAVFIALAASPAPAALMVDEENFTLEETSENPAVDAALADLARDAAKVLGTKPIRVADDRALLRVSVDPGLEPETFVIDIAERVHIRGGDDLGLIYGIYEFSHRFLGVDPFWYWKQIEPEPKKSLALAETSFASGAPAFRYRGWFINDEDLLAAWRPREGQRFLDWPGREEALAKSVKDEGAAYETRLLHYYSPIVGEEPMAMFFEALLRNRCNLVIPASFIDVMNEPEADIVRAAVARGLYVSQHHVEPLGVSHFAYEAWWDKHRGGENAPSFSYRTDADSMKRAWDAYARRWWELAGDRVIWQVGLRGRGDRSLWHHDPGSKDIAGKLIGQALEDQMEIIRRVDLRDQPPATLTLWDEGAHLIAEGKLVLPAEIIGVFADHPVTQQMQEDFAKTPREPGRDYGFYYHIAVWPHGPHLVQGPRPEAIASIVRQVATKGDTTYAMLNVANLREHVMGASAWSAQVWEPHPVTDEEFLEKWSPPGLAEFHRELIGSVFLDPEKRMYDGAARARIYSAIHRLEQGEQPNIPFDEETYRAAAERISGLIERLNAAEVEPRFRVFFDTNVRAQAHILRGLYASLAELDAKPADPAKAAAALDSALKGYEIGESGRWDGWYRGDTKMRLADLRDRLLALSPASGRN